MTVLLPLATGLWIVHRVLLAFDLPAGGDVSFHIARTDFALHQLVTTAHYDGWNPALMEGRQEFLVYGPGLAFVAALLKVLSFGSLSMESVMALIASLSFAATAPAAWYLARSFRIGNVGAGMYALGALTVSVVYGPGLRGTFLYGLMNHQLAIPIALCCIGAFVRLLDGPTRVPEVVAATTAAGLVMTHGQTTIATAVVIAMIFIWRGVVARPSVRSLIAVARAFCVGLGLAAIWLWPMLENHYPRADGAGWTTLKLTDYLNGYVRGNNWTNPIIAAATVCAFVIVAVDACAIRRLTRRVDEWRLAIVFAAPSALIGLYIIRHVWPPLAGVVVIRGLGLVFIVSLLPLAVIVDRVAPRFVAAVPIFAAALAINPGMIPAHDLARPSPGPTKDLREIAAVLRSEVPDHGRFAWIHAPSLDDSFGVGHPEYWLQYQSGRSTMNGFGGESVSSLPFAFTLEMNEWDTATADARLRQAGVTHVVSTPEFAESLAADTDWTPIVEGERYTILASPAGTQLALGSTTDAVQLVSYEPELIRWNVTRADRLVLALPAFRKWHFRLNGEPVETFTHDGHVGIVAPGPGVLTASYRPSAGDLYGRFVTVATLVVWRRSIRRRNSRGDKSTSALIA
ncbi:MAG: hypothetical protein ABI658_13640 [Acidimicrobiales bacterium]